MVLDSLSNGGGDLVLMANSDVLSRLQFEAELEKRRENRRENRVCLRPASASRSRVGWARGFRPRADRPGSYVSMAQTTETRECGPSPSSAATPNQRTSMVRSATTGRSVPDVSISRTQ